MLNKYFNVKIINTGKNSNTGERLKRVKKYINGNFCLTYGDGLSNVNLKKLISFQKGISKELGWLPQLFIPRYF